ncbi:Nif3-like dinuclear metal center hexameric protein [Paenibacillus sp. S150]|uniref:Nif3-like dinuclear metal center hexameric protein n=1 Tax=Paenibacillus sp. S150 TaxID=2749826 RepID=UPI001C57A5FA|nr:Nif3-like dinuclear metal center hexameric protein [Paenibacillus sp. S150]
MAACEQVMNVLNTIVPFACVAARDNSGLVVGDPAVNVDAVLMAVDLTEAVIEEAIRLGCGMIVTHHHIMGKGVKRITPDTFEGRAVSALTRNNIALVVCHNNLDFLTHGTADTLMRAAGAASSRPLYEGYAFLATTPAEVNAASIPVPEGEGIDPDLEAGFGRVGPLSVPCTLIELIKRLEGTVTGPVNVVGADDRFIQTIAVQVGAGERSDLDRAKLCGAELLISGDVRHDNRLYAAEIGMCLLDFCHYEVELPGILSLMSRLKQALDQGGYNVQVILSRAEAPVRHMVMPGTPDLDKYGL